MFGRSALSISSDPQVAEAVCIPQKQSNRESQTILISHINPVRTFLMLKICEYPLVVKFMSWIQAIGWMQSKIMKIRVEIQ